MILVGCGKAKRSRPAPARDLYIGSLFVATRRYAEARGEPWFVASGGHGLLLPDQVLEPYDARAPFDRLSRSFWAKVVVDRLEAVVGGPEFVELCMGAGYAEPLSEELWRRGWANEQPLAGLGLGYRLSWLSKKTAELLRAEAYGWSGAAG